MIAFEYIDVNILVYELGLLKLTKRESIKYFVTWNKAFKWHKMPHKHFSFLFILTWFIKIIKTEKQMYKKI